MLLCYKCYLLKSWPLCKVSIEFIEHAHLNIQPDNYSYTNIYMYCVVNIIFLAPCLHERRHFTLIGGHCHLPSICSKSFCAIKVSVLLCKVNTGSASRALNGCVDAF